MPEMSLRDQQRALTRERILAGARSVFGRTAYHDVVVDDIVKAAGISRATFYLHYHAKREVLDDLVRPLRAELDVLWPKVGALVDPTAAEVEPIVACFLDTIAAHREAFVAWMQAGAVGDELREVNRRDLSLVERLVFPDGSPRAKRLPEGERLARVTAMVAVLERTCDYWFHLDLPLERDAVARAVAASWSTTLTMPVPKRRR